jgi:hypothetical protein
MKKTTLLDSNKEIYLHVNGRMLWIQQGDYCLARAGEWGLQVFKPPHKQRSDGNDKLAYINKAPIPFKEKSGALAAFRIHVTNQHGVSVSEEALESISPSVWSKG